MTGFLGDKPFGEIFLGSKPVEAIYLGSTLAWTAEQPWHEPETTIYNGGGQTFYYSVPSWAVYLDIVVLGGGGGGSGGDGALGNTGNGGNAGAWTSRTV
ncbi:hypothetical protein GS504_00430, partial [Rhodococcus hoagii]|nr:hypothetical protein [Prescottella equi]